MFIHRLRRFTQIMQGKIAESGREVFVVRKGNEAVSLFRMIPMNRKTLPFASSESVKICDNLWKMLCGSFRGSRRKMKMFIHRLHRFTQIMQRKIAESRREVFVVRKRNEAMSLFRTIPTN